MQDKNNDHPPGAPAAISIRSAEPADAAMLTEVAFAGKRHWGYPEHWINAWRQQLTILPEFIAQHQTYIAEIDGHVAGFCALDHAGAQINLEHLWVLPQAMGRGVGRALFARALAWARSLGSEEMSIESDPNAVCFYERMGARRIGVTVTELDGQLRELPVLVCETG